MGVGPGGTDVEHNENEQVGSGDNTPIDFDTTPRPAQPLQSQVMRAAHAQQAQAQLKENYFFKQKTAYEIKECDWSSDVCSSDLVAHRLEEAAFARMGAAVGQR